MSAATPADLANVIKLLERLRTGELNVIPGSTIQWKEDASTTLLQRKPPTPISADPILREVNTYVATPATTPTTSAMKR